MSSDLSLHDADSPSDADTRLAAESSRKLADLFENRQQSLHLWIQADNGSEETIPIPASAFRLLSDILAEMGKGNSVTILPGNAELTTQEAADVIGLSRSFLVQLVDDGKIPCNIVGMQRRIRIQDLIEFKRRIDQERLKTLEELAAQAQELNMGY